jgi:hypothetical protein
MNMATKQSIFEEHLEAWLEAKGDKVRRGEITDHIVFVTGCHRKSVPRSFTRAQMKDGSVGESRGRKVVYTPDVLAALYTIWEASDWACGELLHPMIHECAEILQRDNMWIHSAEATDKLLGMSLGTCKRKVRNLRKRHGRLKGRSSTKPSSLKSIIPIFKGPWNTCGVGEGQIDTVAHCGTSLFGDYVFSLCYVDAATYWTLVRAQWNKGQQQTVDSLISIQEKLPFPLCMLHPDSGSEFINWVAKRWADSQGIRLTRSESNHKNDNMFVEERNGHVVRRYLGYDRLDKPELVPLLSNFYDVLCLYLNHFKAVRRQLEKTKVGSKYVRRYERVAKTPYQRVRDRNDVSEETKQCLKEEHSTLNPLVLKRQIDTLRVKIFTLNATHE